MSRNRIMSAWRQLLLALTVGLGLVSMVGSGGAPPRERPQLPTPPSLFITSHPQDVTVHDGEPATFAVGVSDSAAEVVWQRCEPAGQCAADTDSGWTNLNAGAPSLSFTIDAATLTDNGARYRAAVTSINAAGVTLYSNATLTVLPAVPPTITAQPASVTLLEGQSATFTVAASGTALQYQWERADDASSPFAPIPGATATSYTKANVQFVLSPAGDNNARFRVVVSNSGGAVTSDPPAILTVTPAVHAPLITQAPQSIAVTANATASFSVVASGTPPLAYRWRKNGANVGANAATLSFVATQADDGAAIDVVVSNSAGAVTSAAATLTVTPGLVAPTITTQPQDSAVGVGGTAAFSVVAAGTSPSYQWQRSNDGGASFGVAQGTNDQPTYQLANAQLADSGARFRVVVSNAAGGVVSNTATLTVTAFAASAVATGTGCSFALRPNGQVYSFGSDQEECLGNGAGITRRDTPGPVPGIADAVQLAGGAYGYHALVVRSNGEVWGWGYDLYGQLGVGRLGTQPQTQPSPVRMTTAATGNPPVSNAAAVARGSYHSLVLLGSGTVLAAGFNINGQLGDGSTANRNRAVVVPGLTGVIAIAAGERYSMALRNDGTVWAWGVNNWGQLGNGSTNTQSLSPVQVSGLTNVVAISAGNDHALALDGNGDVWAWGHNDKGQLGDASGVTLRRTPGKAAVSGVAAIAAGWKHALAVLTADGSIRAWGYNVNGQLGAGDLVDRPSPTAVPGLPRMRSVAAGFQYTLATDAAGNVWGWGSNGVGELGLGVPTIRFSTPQQLPGAP